MRLVPRAALLALLVGCFAEDPSLGGALTDQLALRQVLQTQAPRGLHAEVVSYPKERHVSVVLQGAIDGLRTWAEYVAEIDTLLAAAPSTWPLATT